MTHWDGPMFTTEELLRRAEERADKAEAANALLVEYANHREAERDAARADAERLAGKAALWHGRAIEDGSHVCQKKCSTVAALAAHEALVIGGAVIEGQLGRTDRRHARSVHLREHDEDESDPGEWCPRCRELDEPTDVS